MKHNEMNLLKVFQIVAMLFGSNILVSQNTPQDTILQKSVGPLSSKYEIISDDSIYEFSKIHLARLLGVRGSTGIEIDSVIEQFRANSITSSSKFAENLELLFSKNQQVAFLCYFYHKNELTKILFEPGKIVEVDKIRITETELIDLRENVINSMNISELTYNRYPQRRGIVSPNSNKPKPSFNSSVERATKILLTSSFDEKYRHLVVVPVFNIGAFPFHLLKPYRDSSFLIDKCSFTIAPSLLDLITIRLRILKDIDSPVTIKYNSNDDPNDNIPFDRLEEPFKYRYAFYRPLFICNPVYPVNHEYHFPDLPGARMEVDSVIGYCVDYTLLERAEATRENVLNLICQHDVVYFATHGISSQEKPMDGSYLVLSEPSPYLTASDIMKLRLRRDRHFPGMVILSACQTGLGMYMDAGIAGLARSFLISGSNHVITSLWNVDDEATAYLMTRFAYHLNVGEPHYYTPSEQLRLAILDTKKKYDNPALWASFSLFGIFY